MRKVVQWRAVRCPRDGRKTGGKLFHVGSIKLCEFCAKAVEGKIAAQIIRVR
jgi:hypothetical protein